MPSRYRAGGVQSEVEPGSRGRVLRNLLGIRSVREIEKAESVALLAVQERLVEQFSADHRFSANDVRDIHREWLQDIYLWAGQYRNLNLAKGGFQFAAADRIPVLMHQLEVRELAGYTPCPADDLDTTARSIAIVHAELVLIHPFREGNGRCARLLALVMGFQAGMPPLDFSPMEGQGKRRYIAAIHAASRANYEPMVEIFRKVLNRSLQRHARPAGA